MEETLVEKSTKLGKGLKLYFVFSVFILSIFFIYTVIYTIRYNVWSPNEVLERYVILLTLIGIPGILRLFYVQNNKIINYSTEKYIKLYKKYYILRLTVLNCIAIVNIISLHISGSKNFIYMTIIVIFVFFFCIPQKTLYTTIDKSENK
ncbi:hypothetical protein D0T53_02830 [Dysgonomonas sp. 216]|nr:hypothetical protein [Dysgonomonas sp. 216]